MMNKVTIHQGDVLQILRQLPDGSVHCCVTSPPYWGLRDYGTTSWEGGDADCDHLAPAAHGYNPIETSTLGPKRDGIAASNSAHSDSTKRQQFKGICGKCGAVRVDNQIGLEPTIEEYVEKMVTVFREVRRVLRADGTLFLNLGDSYAANGASGLHIKGETSTLVGSANKAHTSQKKNVPNGLKPKDLCMIPARVALALQADGWTLRSDIIWQKPNPMPESCTDRPTTSHEHIFLFSKAVWKGPEPRRFDFISDQDARWLALFLDTEGNICTKRVKRKGGADWFGAQICFANTSRPLVEAALNIIGAGTILERKCKNSPMFYYQLSNRQAADLLYRLYPFLIVKQKQAALAIHLQEVLAAGDHERRTKKGRLRGRTRDDDYSEELLKIWETMKSLNRFGTPDVSWVPIPKYGKWDSSRYFYDAEAVKEECCSGPSDIRKMEESKERIGGFYKDNEDLLVKASKHTNIGRKRSVGSPNGRNCRSVWEFATEPFPGSHFAVFPKELVRRCVAAGTSEKGCCPKCGAPWVRVVEKNLVPTYKAAKTFVIDDRDRAADSQDQGSNRQKDGHKPGYVRADTTLGWQPTCKCPEHEPVPCTVLDPFGGASTTGLVAAKMGRSAILVELKPEYCKMGYERILKELGFLVDLSLCLE